MQKVLQAIGQTAVTALDVSAAAVFSVIPGQAYAEVVLLDADGDVFEHTVIDAPAALHKPLASDGPVLPAGEELEWLLAAISPRLGEARRFWVCLESDAQCIGGVVWGNKSGEGERVGTQVQELPPYPSAGAWPCEPRKSARNRLPGRAIGRGQPPLAQRPGRNPTQQNHRRRRRNGLRRGPRDEQPAGHHQRAITVAGPAINGPQAETRRHAHQRTVPAPQRNHFRTDGFRQAHAAADRRRPISPRSSITLCTMRSCSPIPPIEPLK